MSNPLRFATLASILVAGALLAVPARADDGKRNQCIQDIKTALDLKSYQYYESGCAAIMVPKSGRSHWVPFSGVDRTTYKKSSDGRFYLKAACRSGKACIQDRGTPKLDDKIWWEWKVAKTTMVMKMTSCLEYLYLRCK